HDEVQYVEEEIGEEPAPTKSYGYARGALVGDLHRPALGVAKLAIVSRGRVDRFEARLAVGILKDDGLHARFEHVAVALQHRASRKTPLPPLGLVTRPRSIELLQFVFLHLLLDNISLLVSDCELDPELLDRLFVLLDG